MKLIDADRLLRPQVMSKYYHLANEDIAIPVIDIKHAPPVDAVEVVRCKDCKYYQTATAFGYPIKDCKYYHFEDMETDDYCSRGERKDEHFRRNDEVGGCVIEAD